MDPSAQLRLKRVGWGIGVDTEQFRLAARTVLSPPYHAMPLSLAKASIGIAALEALVKANLLTYRPWLGQG